MKKNRQQKRIWIAWERQRRSLELSKSFQCKLFLVLENGLLRYPISIAKTFLIIARERPSVLFVQNPSMILTLLATCCFRLFFKYTVIVDRHSNFLLTKKDANFIADLFFHFISYLTIKYAEMTIVTNEDLANVVEVLGGRARVLPDKIPQLLPSEKIVKLKGQKNILVISSFAGDEPIGEIAEAAADFAGKNIYFYFSGNYKKYHDISVFDNKYNVVLTGYLSDQDFVDLLFSVDIIIVLTTIPFTLLCGCYESVAAEKPFITSDTKALRSLFEGGIFVDNTSKSIIDSVELLSKDINNSTQKIKLLKNSMNSKWNEKFTFVNDEIMGLCHSCGK